MAYPWSSPREGFTPQAWDELLDATAGPTVMLSFTCYQLADLVGDRLHPGHPRLSLSARYVDLSTGGWWGLKAQVSQSLVDESGEAALLAQVRAAAEASNPSYGEISVDNSGHLDQATSLEQALGAFPWQTVRASRRTLRGYSWLTVVAQEIGDRLGGVDGLRATGAFVDVAALHNGGYWLLATPNLADYGPAQAEAARAALAPALPPARRRAPSRDDIFKNRYDVRDTVAHGAVLATRMSGLHERFPDALVWGVLDGEDGPHLVCWGAQPGQAWVWQVLPEDDDHAGMAIARPLEPLLAAVAADPLSAGLEVVAGPVFGSIGLPEVVDVADSAIGPAELITLFDGRPGLQLYYGADEPADDEACAALGEAVALAAKLRAAVSAARL
jgi:hypothetical protein